MTTYNINKVQIISCTKQWFKVRESGCSSVDMDCKKRVPIVLLNIGTH